MNQQDDDLAQVPMWKSYLYHLQQQAPNPKRIAAQRDVVNRPPYYGREYHGAISREDADFMLTIGGEGSYLIRESQRAPGQYTLAIRFEGVTKNFKLYYDNQHYVGEKRFDTIQDLVADGLITFYLESKAADYIAALSSQSNYAESPYIAYNTHKKHQVAAVSGPRRSSGSRGGAGGGEPSSSSGQRSASTSSEAQESGAHGQPALRGVRAANIPLERTRLSQIAESRRSQSDSPVAVPRQPTAAAGPTSPPQQPVVPPSAQSPAAQSKQHVRSSQHLAQTPSRVQSSNAGSGSTETPAAPAAQEPRTSASTNTDGPMLEEFSPPPSSPPLGVSAGLQGAAQDGGKVHNFKASSVTWCTDYLEVMGCEKQHNFKLHTFKGPHWCDYCANFLWGLIAQGVKCQDCGLNAHKRCSEKVPNDCLPDMKYIKRMFGIDLTTLVKAQNTLIPAVVELCIKEIEGRAGLTSEGLYRVAGFHDDVEAIKMAFDKDGEQADISVDRYDDVNTIASVLKLYFRLLPIPLITFDIYFKLIDTVKREDINNDKRLDMIRHSLSQLPPAHYHTLKYLMSHLHRVTEHQQQNMMSPENMAIVFAPTLLRSPETDPLISLSVVKYERELIELLILHHNSLFD